MSYLRIVQASHPFEFKEPKLYMTLTTEVCLVGKLNTNLALNRQANIIIDALVKH